MTNALLQSEVVIHVDGVNRYELVGLLCSPLTTAGTPVLVNGVPIKRITVHPEGCVSLDVE